MSRAYASVQAAQAVNHLAERDIRNRMDLHAALEEKWRADDRALDVRVAALRSTLQDSARALAVAGDALRGALRENSAEYRALQDELASARMANQNAASRFNNWPVLSA